nr:integrase, catalytic region, zinc finger, CCHC-type, peptidase aspartic, catalytic [Tanacetum cinerariifolium]
MGQENGKTSPVKPAEPVPSARELASAAVGNRDSAEDCATLVKMSRDVLTVGSTMRIPLLYRGEYSQWSKRFMNYLEEQTDGEAMINFIKYGLPNDIYSLIDSKKTAKDLWDALTRHMFDSEYGEQYRKAAVLYEYETFKATEGELLLDTYIRYIQMINDLKKCGYSKDNCELNFKFLNNLQPEWKQSVNNAMGLKKKTVVVTSYPLALIAGKTKVSRKKKVVVSSDSDGNDADDFSELKKITALLAKSFNRRKFYSKPTNNNLRTSSASQSANKKQEYVKSDDKKVEKKDDEKKRDMSKVKCHNCKKEGHFAKDCKKAKVKDYEYCKTKMLLAKKDKDEQVLLTEDHAWMESSSDSDQEINANMVFMTQIKKVLSDSEASSSSADNKISEVSYYISESESESEYETSEYYDNTTTYGLFVNDNDDQEIFHDCENFPENLIESQIDHNESAKANQQNKDFENKNKDLQDKYDVLKNQATTFEMKNNELNEQMKVLIEKNDDLLAQTNVLKNQLQIKHVVINTHVECQEKYAKLEAERYEYMIRYSAYFYNDKQHKKQIADQEVLYDKMSVQLVEMDKHVRDLKNMVLEKEFKISELEECVCNKDLEIEKCLKHLNDGENKLHKMGQTNQTIHMIMPSKDKMYNGRKEIGFENPNYFCKEKDLRPTLYDERVINLGKENLKIIKSLKSKDVEKGVESSEKVVSETENKSENDCQVIEKVCDSEENPNVIAPGIFKLNLDTLSSVRRPKPSGVMWMRKGSSNTVKADFSSVNHSNLNKTVKRYSRKNLMACNNFDTRSVFDCNNARNTLCNARMNASVDVNDLFVFDDIVQIYLWIIDSGCSKHMTGNRALLTNFMEKFLGTVRFGNNDFAVIAGYEDVVIGSITIKKVYYVEGL